MIISRNKEDCIKFNQQMASRIETGRYQEFPQDTFKDMIQNYTDDFNMYSSEMSIKEQEEALNNIDALVEYANKKYPDTFKTNDAYKYDYEPGSSSVADDRGL